MSLKGQTLLNFRITFRFLTAFSDNLEHRGVAQSAPGPELSPLISRSKKGSSIWYLVSKLAFQVEALDSSP